MEKSDKLVKNMNDGGDVSILFVKAIESLQYYEKEFVRFEATEKERLRLLKENQELKDKIDRQNVIEKYIQEEAKRLNETLEVQKR